MLGRINPVLYLLTKLILYYTSVKEVGKYNFYFRKYTNSSDRSVIITLLNEMDGFNQREYVFVMGATDFVDNLDSAALRPGRFDKIINVPIPDTSGRKEIFDLYIKKVIIFIQLNKITVKRRY